MSLGKKVAVADFVKPSPQGTTWGLGGTCVNVGCIPKKLMHFVSSMGELRQDMGEVGWSVDSKTPHNWELMMEKVNGHVRSLNFGYKSTMIKNSISYFNALATIKDAHTIELKNKKDEVE